MKAYVFPGQAAQFVGMGQDMYESSALARELFEEANAILGFPITEVMFSGTEEDLKETKVTQPSVFLHSVIRAKMAGDDFRPDMVAGHSLGEFSALVANGALDFASGLQLVYKRALAMQQACEQNPGTMAAIVGLDDAITESICQNIDDVVVPANYNCPGQLVISGSMAGVETATAKLTEAGAKRAIIIAVGGAFHSPLMKQAEDELAAAIEATSFRHPACPIYQNVDAKPHLEPADIKANLIKQLTAPVRWTAIMEQMIADGATQFIEVGGTGKMLTSFVKRIDRNMPTEAL
ncbi:MAG: ACP S-malonyltransferase [Saprospiraceae bacterium]|nr:ACP S-malonyltransferase [Saprospiraceae bacterium]MCB9319194.1 ACP S-malonyltransferase [Lewinellaceae bacterium]